VFHVGHKQVLIHSKKKSNHRTDSNRTPQGYCCSIVNGKFSQDIYFIYL